MSSSNEYQKLKKVWYAKLKESGFNDIETKDENLRGGSSNWRFNSKFTTRYSHKSKEEYTYQATQFLNRFTFDSEMHRAIWAYHVEGLSMDEITKILKSLGKFSYKRNTRNAKSPSINTVWRIIDKYRKIMKANLE